MVITVYESVKKGSAIVECKSDKFINKYNKMYFTTDNLLKTMTEIATWCNNELKEECLFEMG